MSTYEEIIKFLSQFKSSSYNENQIGNNKQLIIKIYEYLTKISEYKEQKETIIKNIAYEKKDLINIPIYLEIISKSMGHLNVYNLKDIITIVKQVHDVYFNNASKIELDEYIHATDDEKIRKLFLTQNNKYIIRSFDKEDILPYVNDLKFALAIELTNKEYQDFINYIDNFDLFQNNYSALMMYKNYKKIRKNLKGLSKLFWDLLFGNEYMVALVKYNLSIKTIYKKPFNNQMNTNNIQKFQIATIFSSRLLTDFDTEKEMLEYYERLTKYNRETIILPKLKTNSNYLYK